MNSIIRFFLTIKESLYSPSFYASLQSRSLGSVIGYFILLSLVSAAVVLIFSGGTITQGVTELRSVFIEEGVASYPADLEITVKENIISSNKNGAYSVSWPTQAVEHPEHHHAHLVVVDTTSTFSLKKWEEADTVVLVNSDLVAYEDSKGFKLATASHLPPGTLTKAVVETYYQKFLPLIQWLPTLALIGIGLLMCISFFLFNGIFALLLAVPVLILAHNLKKSFTYADAYKTTLHAMTLGFFLLIAENIGIPHIPFVFSIITLAVVYANLTGKSR